MCHFINFISFLTLVYTIRDSLRMMYKHRNSRSFLRNIQLIYCAFDINNQLYETIIILLTISISSTSFGR